MEKENALENGSGVTNLNYYIENNLVTDYDYLKEKEKAKLEEGIEIRNKEQFISIKIYRKFYRPPLQENSCYLKEISKNVHIVIRYLNGMEIFARFAELSRLF